jgi:hypothetical protein
VKKKIVRAKAYPLKNEQIVQNESAVPSRDRRKKHASKKTLCQIDYARTTNQAGCEPVAKPPKNYIQTFILSNAETRLPRLRELDPLPAYLPLDRVDQDITETVNQVHVFF